VRAHYGPDTIFVREARLPITDLPMEARVEQIAGCVTFDHPHAPLPATDRPIPGAGPTQGPFFVEGTAQVDLSQPTPLTDYQLRVTTERAAISKQRGITSR
jgi:hypothetical protein